MNESGLNMSGIILAEKIWFAWRNPVHVSLCPPQILHRSAWDQMVMWEASGQPPDSWHRSL